MTWTEWLLIVPAICYIIAGVGYAAKGNWGFAVTYMAYATAIGGMILAAIRA